MILDIDIRVSNDSGVQIQQFSKHFDSRFEGTSSVAISNTTISKGFEEFLAEYLTGSGRVIRNNLITEPATNYNVQNSSASLGDIEYTLKLGNSESVSGHIPLSKLLHLKELSTAGTYSTPTTSSSEYSIGSKVDGNKHTSPEQDSILMKRNPFKAQLTLTDVDNLFRQIITSAVSRYEDSFYVENLPDSSFAESS